MCFPFPFVFSVHNLSQRQVCGTVAKQKNTCLSIYLFVFSYLFVFAVCLFFSKFFRFILMCFWTFILLFLLSFLNVFSSITPFLCISFSWRLCLVWSSYFFSFFYFSPFTYSPCSQDAMFFELFPFARSLKKYVFLVCWSLKNVPLYVLFLVFSSQEKLQKW